jgi:F0F1-type ATP synthase assembly protein I
MSDPQPTSGASTASTAQRPARPVWLLPVIMTVVTGVIGMFLVAGQGLYWMIAVIALVDALGVFTIVRSARINARSQQARALEVQNQEIRNRP